MPVIQNSDVRATIASLPNTANIGIDGISACLLKDSAPVISNKLANIFNCFITSGIFLEQWNTALTVPVHKKGNIFDVSNYRPISLFLILSSV